MGSNPSTETKLVLIIEIIIMGMFSEIIAEENIRLVLELKSKYMSNENLSQETKNVLEEVFEKVINIVAD